jgi:hypothetical protein
MANFFLFCISSNHFRRQLKRTLCSKRQGDKPGFQYQSNASTMNTTTRDTHRNSGNNKGAGSPTGGAPSRVAATNRQHQYQQQRVGSLATENLRSHGAHSPVQGNSPTGGTPERSILMNGAAGRGRKHHSLDSSAIPVRTRLLLASARISEESNSPRTPSSRSNGHANGQVEGLDMEETAVPAFAGGRRPFGGLERFKRRLRELF